MPNNPRLHPNLWEVANPFEVALLSSTFKSLSVDRADIHRYEYTFANMNRFTYICESCARYIREPVWGHQNCSAHRTCAAPLHWDPWECKDCNTQRDMLEFMTVKGITDSFVSLEKFLQRTRKWKADKANVPHWDHFLDLQEFMAGYEQFSPMFAQNNENIRNGDYTVNQTDERNNDRTDGDDDARSGSGGAQTPGSVTKYVRTQHIDHDLYEPERNISRNSVRSALTENA